MDAYSVPPGRRAVRSGCQRAMGVLVRAQGTNATGTPVRCEEQVATSGQTDPPAQLSWLTLSTWPAGESTGRAVLPASSLPNMAARSVGLE